MKRVQEEKGTMALNEAIIKLIWTLFLWKHDLDNALMLTNLLPEPQKKKVLEQLLGTAVEEGWLNHARKIAALMERELTTQELNLIITTCLKRGWLINAAEAAALLPDSLKIPLLIDIFRMYLERMYLDRTMLTEAERIANMLDEPWKTKLLQILQSNFKL
jgi:hypothetical protein